MLQTGWAEKLIRMIKKRSSVSPCHQQAHQITQSRALKKAVFLIHISMIGIYNFLCLWVFVCTVRFRAASGLGIMPRGGSGGQNGDMDLKCCRKEKCRTKAVGSRFPPAARFLRIFLILRNFYWNFEGLSDTSSMACKRLRKSRLAAF